MEKFQEQLIKNPLILLVFIVLFGGGSGFIGRVTAPSQDASIKTLEKTVTILEERVSVLKESKDVIDKIPVIVEKQVSTERKLDEINKRLDYVISLISAGDAVKKIAETCGSGVSE